MEGNTQTDVDTAAAAAAAAFAVDTTYNSKNSPPTPPHSSSLPSTLRKVSSFGGKIEMPRMRKLHLLVASNGPKDAAFAEALAVRVSRESSIEVRAIVDEVPNRLSQEITVLQNRSLVPRTHDKAEANALEFYRRQAFDLVEWADLFVLAPVDADNIAKMLVGISDTVLLEVLRGWNVSKRIILVPGMGINAWNHPTTMRQLAKIKRRWNWVRVWPNPILWEYSESHPKRICEWHDFKSLVDIVKNKADVLLMCDDIDPKHSNEQQEFDYGLPLELWLMILEHMGDWEMAQALGFTGARIQKPHDWSISPENPDDPICVYNHELEWLLLHGSIKQIYRKLSQAPENLMDLSPRAVRLIIKFDLTNVLSYLEHHNHALFWNTFSGETLPLKASVSWSRPNILEWWKNSPSFSVKHYDHEPMNGASMYGHIPVLEWWRKSGLELRYTDAALEQATVNGKLGVLSWWRDSAMQDDRIILKPGKSLGLAAQHGNWKAIQWWDASGVSAALADRVCKIASSYGQVEVLELWRKIKGENMPYDARVLNEPTKQGHINVLNWWKQYARGELPGLDGRTHKVEYKTCDIEEALEDCVGDEKEVRRWWADNGLNLELLTKEWMKARSL